MTILILAADTSVSPQVNNSSRALWMKTYWAYKMMQFITSHYETYMVLQTLYKELACQALKYMHKFHQVHYIHVYYTNTLYIFVFIL